MKRSVYALAIGLIMCVATPAMANGPSPLLLTSIFHLLLGNAVFGVIEGLLIAWLFGRRRSICVILMVVANYLSAWAAILLLYRLLTSLSLDLYSVLRWNLYLLAPAFSLTLLLEWPFVAASLRGLKAWPRKSALVTLLVNCVTWPMLGLMLWVSSSTSLATHAVPLSALRLPADISVYYIGQGDGDVYRIDLPSTQAQHVHNLASVDTNDRLCVNPSKDRPGHWDLLAWLEHGHSFGGRLLLVEPVSSLCVAPQALYRNGEVQFSEVDLEQRGTNMSSQLTARVGSAKDSPLYVSPELDGAQGLLFQSQDGSSLFRLAIDTPIARWFVSNVTHLPEDYIVFQLGWDQICIAEPKTWNVALLARGRGPVAVVRQATADLR